ncbi:MAG: hypothetical protein HC881_14745 [Leptolyngbyaceae cyanobacterium SL_7_1]|nr:hypothetical protein [Leptolyngbyaceae cyanobacterium SL_7_1]
MPILEVSKKLGLLPHWHVITEPSFPFALKELRPMNRWVLSLFILVAGIAPTLPATANLLIAQLEQSMQPSSTATASTSAVDLAWELIQAATAQAQAGDRPLALATLARAAEQVETIEDATVRDRWRVEVIRQYARLGADTEAIALSQTMDYNTQSPDYCCLPFRTEAEQAITQAYLDAGAIDRALEFAERIEFSASREQLLTPIVLSLAMQGEFERAIALVEPVSDPTQKIGLQYTILKGYLHTEAFFEGLRFTQRFADPMERSGARYLLAQAAWRSGQFNTARTIASQIETPDNQIHALSQLALANADVGQTEDALSLLSLAFERTQATSEPRPLAQWAGYYAQIGDFDRATRLVNETEHDYDRAAGNLAVAQAYLATGRFAAAFASAQQVADGQLQPLAEYPDPKLELLQTLVNQAIRTGQDQVALQVARSFSKPEQQVQALLAIAQHYTAHQQAEQATTILAEAVEVATSIERIGIFPDRHTYFEMSNSGVLIDIAQAYLAVDQTAAATTVLSQAIDSIATFEPSAAGWMVSATQSLHLRNLTTIAQMLIEAGAPDRARGAAELAAQFAPTAPDAHSPIAALTQAAQIQAIVGNLEQARTLLATATTQSEALPAPEKARTQSVIAISYAAIGDETQALAMLDAALPMLFSSDPFPSAESSDWQLGNLAVALTVADSIELPMTLIDRISNPVQQAVFTNNVAHAYITSDRQALAEAAIQQLLQRVDRLQEPIQQDNLLNIAVCNPYASEGCPIGGAWKYDLAMQLANRIQNPGMRANQFFLIAQAYSRAGETEQAATAIGQAIAANQQVPSPFDRREALFSWMDAFLRDYQYDLAVPVANAFAEPSYRITALRRLAHQQARLGNSERATAMLTQAQAIAEDMEDWWMRSQVLQAIDRQQSGLAISD